MAVLSSVSDSTLDSHERRHICTFGCGWSFHREQEKARHEREVHEGKCYGCPFCLGRKWSRKNRAVKHILSVHNSTRPPSVHNNLIQIHHENFLMFDEHHDVDQESHVSVWNQDLYPAATANSNYLGQQGQTLNEHTHAHPASQNMAPGASTTYQSPYSLTLPHEDLSEYPPLHEEDEEMNEYPAPQDEDEETNQYAVPEEEDEDVDDDRNRRN